MLLPRLYWEFLRLLGLKFGRCGETLRVISYSLIVPSPEEVTS